jgi:hypothetical protein
LSQCVDVLFFGVYLGKSQSCQVVVMKIINMALNVT